MPSKQNLEPGRQSGGGEINVALSDGLRLSLCRVRASDRVRAQQAFGKLSTQSRYLKFFIQFPILSDEKLTRLTETEQEKRIVWCALDSDDESTPGLGAASFRRMDGDPSLAEISINVLDESHNRSIETVLLAVLCIEAERLGIKTLQAFALGTHASFVNWFRALGARIHYASGQFEIALDFDMLNDPTSLPSTRAAEYLYQWHQKLQNLMG